MKKSFLLSLVAIFMPFVAVMAQDAASSKADGKIDGYEYVDLGLSVKWASCNIGAATPEGYGKYFAWADVKGQTWNGSKWSAGGFVANPPYQLDANKNLAPQFDAAQVIWGGKWRMPTKAEMLELEVNCTSEWVADYNGTGVAGRVFTSKKDGFTGKSIFLPAAGYCDGEQLNDTGIFGCYWASTLYSNPKYPEYRDSFGCGLAFHSDRFVQSGYFNRYYGVSIRPVCK